MRLLRLVVGALVGDSSPRQQLRVRGSRCCHRRVVWGQISTASKNLLPVDKVITSRVEESSGRTLYLVQWIAPNPNAPDEPLQTWELHNPLAEASM